MIMNRSAPEPEVRTPRRTGDAIARLAGVTKRYGGVTALDDVDIAIRPGEVVALLGPNGAGKTTAVQLMLGLLRTTSGRATLFDQDPRNAAARSRAGVMLQLSGVPATLTVREHIELFASYYPQPLPIGATVEAAGLEGLENRLYAKLSGGQKQRLHLALALCGNPDVLFLDEPTTGLDVGSRRALWDQVRGFLGGGRTVVLTTHYLEEADALADRVIVMDHGRVIAEGTPAQIKAQVKGRRIRCVTSVPADVIRAMDGVGTVRMDGAALEALVARAEPVVFELLRRDPQLRDLEVGGAGLEEAFLALTSRDAATSRHPSSGRTPPDGPSLARPSPESTSPDRAASRDAEGASA